MQAKTFPLGIQEALKVLEVRMEVIREGRAGRPLEPMPSTLGCWRALESWECSAPMPQSGEGSKDFPADTLPGNS